MDRDETKRLIKMQEPTFLSSARHKGYICPVCRNGSGQDGDGILRTPRSEYFHCFKCGLHDDVFGLIGKAFDLPDFKDQYAKACDLYGLDKGELKKPAAPLVEFDKPEEEQPVDHSEDIQKWNRALNDGDNPGLAYMQARGLSLETLNRFKVGYAESWRNPKVANGKKKAPASPRVIIPTSPFSYLARDPRDPEKLTDTQKKYTKIKVGRVRIFNPEALMTTDSAVFLTEGEIDAMSIEEIGSRAVGIGGASNKREILELIKDRKPNATIVILPDNDESGQTAASFLAEQLKAGGVKHIVANVFGDCKDANELLQKDRKLLEAQIAALKRQAAETGNQKMPPKDIDAGNRALVEHLNLHPRHTAWLKAKGFTDEQIERFCYRSTPSSPKAVCRVLKRSGCTLKGNPTFKPDEDGEMTIRFASPGFLIPVRNTKGRIQDFEFHSDDGKVFQGGRIHFRRGARGINEAVILGSALEADTVCALSGYTVLAIPETFTERLLSIALKSLYEKGLRKARISYDLWTESEPDRKRLAQALKASGIELSMMKKVSEQTLDEYLLGQLKK